MGGWADDPSSKCLFILDSRFPELIKCEMGLIAHLYSECRDKESSKKDGNIDKQIWLHLRNSTLVNKVERNEGRLLTGVFTYTHTHTRHIK